jgi:putative SOS response-associated peptidase YedK
MPLEKSLPSRWRLSPSINQQSHDWLDPEITSTSDVLGLLERSAGVPIDAYPVSRLVNKPSVDGQELIRPIE